MSKHQESEIRVPGDPRQRLFADFVFSGVDSSEAYRRAGYKAKTPGAKAACASRLLKSAKVSAYLEDLNRLAAKGAVKTKHEVMEWLSRVLEADPTRRDCDPALMQECVREEIGDAVAVTRIKLVSKMEAVKELAKMLAWYEAAKLEVSATDELAEALAKMRNTD